MMRHRVSIAGVLLDAVTFDEAIARIGDFLDRPGYGAAIVTPNPEMLVAADRDPAFKKILNDAALAVPDGVGLVLAARGRLPARVTGTDLLPAMLRLAADRGESVFFLGAAPGVARDVADIFQKKIPALRVAGTFSGSPRSEEEDTICDLIRASGATMLFVAFGAPAQEKWIARHLHDLPAVKVAIGVGGAFDFHAGRVPRAPLLFRKLGLEWLFRLVMQPSRVGRIFTAVILFPLLVLRRGVQSA